MHTIVLPYPLSTNRYWRSVVMPGASRATILLSAEAKAFKTEVGWRCREAGIRSMLTGRLQMHVRLFPQRPVDWQTMVRRRGPERWDDDIRCIDLGNCEKVLSDAMQGIVFEDDKQVWQITLVREEPDDRDARTVVTIGQLPPRETPQASLALRPPLEF